MADLQGGLEGDNQAMTATPRDFADERGRLFRSALAKYFGCTPRTVTSYWARPTVCNRLKRVRVSRKVCFSTVDQVLQFEQQGR